MKIWHLECTDEELMANRGIMDNVVDAMSNMFNGVFGNCKPAFDENGDVIGGGVSQCGKNSRTE